MNKMLMVFLGILVLFGCSSPERTPEEVAAAAKARNQCVKEAPMGSIRRVSRCRSEAQVRAEREAAQEAMRNRTTITGGGSAESQ